MLEGTKCVARELRGPMRGLLVLEAVKYRRSDSYLTGLGGYFANVARSGLPMSFIRFGAGARKKASFAIAIGAEIAW